MRKPHQRHAVGRYHAGFIVNAAQPLVAPALHHAVDASDADVIAAALVDPALYRRDGVVQVDAADADAENVHPIVAENVAGAQTGIFHTSFLASLGLDSRPSK